MTDDFLPLKNDLLSAFIEIKNQPCFIHSDLFKIGIPVRKKIDKTFLCSFYEQVLMEVCNNGLIIPTFNYDFCSKGIYDVIQSPSQIGILSDYFRKKHPAQRTIDPVFNAVLLNYPYQGLGNQRVFGPNSLFKTLVDNDAHICFLGAGFESNTFIHYVEEVNNVGYRYIKQFTGTVINGQSEQSSVTIDYRVRPMIENSCNYRWTFLENELREAGLITSKNICNGNLLFFNAKKVLAFWTERLQQDELYLLNDESRTITLDLYSKFSKPLPNIEKVNL